MKLRSLKAFVMIVLGLMFFSKVQAQPINGDKELAKAFVQKFYDWYIKVYAKQRHIDAHFAVIKNRPQYLDKNLFNAIVADDRAQAMRPREIIGLGFDPFTNTLDTRKGFQTGLVTQKGNKFLVDVHQSGIGRSTKAMMDSRLILTAEVIKMNGKYVFDNFIYPKIGGYISDGNNLLNILDSLHKDRIKQGIEKI